MFYVYLLQSQKDSSFYIGQTEDLSSRLARHNAGFVHSTKQRAPWCLVGYEEYNTREEARWREYQLKANFSEKKKFVANFCARNSTDRMHPSEG